MSPLLAEEEGCGLGRHEGDNYMAVTQLPQCDSMEFSYTSICVVQQTVKRITTFHTGILVLSSGFDSFGFALLPSMDGLRDTSFNII